VQRKTELGRGSQHSILACHEVAGSIQSCIKKRQKGKKATQPQPQFNSKSITYDNDRRTLSVFPDKEQVSVSLTVLGDYSRVRADLALPSNENGSQYQYLDDEEWEGSTPKALYTIETESGTCISGIANRSLNKRYRRRTVRYGSVLFCSGC
jgi:hypothetical protein